MTATAAEAPVLSRLSTLDRFLPLWIALAMGAGLGLGRAIPSLNDNLDRLRVGTVSLPIAALVTRRAPRAARRRGPRRRRGSRAPRRAGGPSGRGAAS